MNNNFLQKLEKMLKQAHSEVLITHQLEFKNVFGAVAGYVEGHIFISCGKFGVALRLPPKVLELLFKEKNARHLKYFPNGHIKKEYAVLQKRILEDKKQFKALLDESIKYASSQK